jgi:acyl carrier protein
MTIEEKIINIMEESFDTENINENSTNENTENWESITFLILIVNLEKEFKISFEPEELVDLNSFLKIKSVINAKLD